MILDLTTTKYSIIMCKEDDERGEKKMYLAGMQKLSLLDFPGVVACTLFTFRQSARIRKRSLPS